VPRLLDPDTAAAWVELLEATAEHAPPCANDPEAWFADAPDLKAYAERACTGCHAIGVCATYATAAGERHGVWAGVDRTQRRRTVPMEVVVA